MQPLIHALFCIFLIVKWHFSSYIRGAWTITIRLGTEMGSHVVMEGQCWWDFLSWCFCASLYFPLWFRLLKLPSVSIANSVSLFPFLCFSTFNNQYATRFCFPPKSYMTKQSLWTWIWAQTLIANGLPVGNEEKYVYTLINRNHFLNHSTVLSIYPLQ